MSATVTINREVLERLLEARARLLFSAAATIRHVESFLENCSDRSDDGHVSEEQACEVRYVLHGVQKLIEDTTGEVEIAFLEREAERIAERERDRAAPG